MAITQTAIVGWNDGTSDSFTINRSVSGNSATKLKPTVPARTNATTPGSISLDCDVQITAGTLFMFQCPVTADDALRIQLKNNAGTVGQTITMAAGAVFMWDSGSQITNPLQSAVPYLGQITLTNYGTVALVPVLNILGAADI